MPRFYCPVELRVGAELDLPAEAARHVQVFRMQPGETITLFNGAAGAPAGEYTASRTAAGSAQTSSKCLRNSRLRWAGENWVLM